MLTRRTLLALAAALPLLLPAAALPADPPPPPAPGGTEQAGTADWPRALALPDGTAVVYQPQVEKLEGAVLSGRAALSWEATGKAPIFGVFWFTAQLQIDKEEETATVESLKVTKVRFPNITKEVEASSIRTLEAELPKWDLDMTLAELQAALAAGQRETQGETRLQTKPPKLLFSRDPAVLLLYDGKPALQALPGSSLERVVNTQLFVVKDPAVGRLYLSGGQFWYEAADPMGPWTYAGAPSAAVKEFIAKNPAPPPAQPEEAAAPPPGTPPPAAEKPSSPPRIIVATEPTELIVFDGAPSYAPVGEAADLLYADNADSPVLLHVPTNESWVLVSGRWYKAKTLEGPWTFVRPDQLPPSFAKIPPEGLAAGVRPFVPGTTEAADALADTQIPQTSAVKRDQKLEVTYDGEPKFKAIEGTGMAYATNTPFSVLKDSGAYWCCHQAVWYVAAGPKGPWAVSDRRPPSIDQVPPSVPVYNTRYVYVYQSTPQVVYVGYLPGYVGVYPYYGTVVYGTGYYYPPYIGPTVYYAYPATYGVHVVYSPYVGWGVGVSYAAPFIAVGIRFGGYHHHHGYYGPHGYRPPPRPPYGYRPPPPGYRPPAGGRPGYGGAPGHGGAPGARPPAGGAGARPSTGNVYNKPENSARNASREAGATPRQQPAGSRQPNNVYGDKSGNVYRQNQGGGWDKNTGQGWQSQGGAGGAKPSQGTGAAGGGGARPAQGGGSKSSYGGAPAGLGNDAAARGRSSGGYGGGGGRGGGGRGGGGRR